MLSTADAEFIHGRGGRKEKMSKEYRSREIRVDILDNHRNQEDQRREERDVGWYLVFTSSSPLPLPLFLLFVV